MGGVVSRRAGRSAEKKGLTGARKRQYIGGALERASEGNGGKRSHKPLKLRKKGHPRRYRASAGTPSIGASLRQWLHG